MTTLLKKCYSIRNIPMFYLEMHNIYINNLALTSEHNVPIQCER